MQVSQHHRLRETHAPSLGGPLPTHALEQAVSRHTKHRRVGETPPSQIAFTTCSFRWRKRESMTSIPRSCTRPLIPHPHTHRSCQPVAVRYDRSASITALPRLPPTALPCLPPTRRPLPPRALPPTVVASSRLHAEPTKRPAASCRHAALEQPPSKSRALTLVSRARQPRTRRPYQPAALLHLALERPPAS
jgi:hypothetical protein